MLIEFTVGNFLSFKTPTKLSMVAAKIKSRDHSLDENNVFEVQKGLKLLTSAAIYGANASGKSNLIYALSFMRKFILNSSKESQEGEPIPIKPFLLSTETENEPSFFEAIFLIDSVQYRYGFESSQEHIVTEWLFNVPSTKEANLFIRDENGIKIASKFKEGKGLESKTRSNALFLSVAAQFNGTISKAILKWFMNMVVISGLDDYEYQNFTLLNFTNGDIHDDIIRLVRELDLGISGIYHEEKEKSELSFSKETPDEVRDNILNNTDLKVIALKTIHEKWDNKKPVEKVAFNLDQESNGTQKLFFLAGPLLDALAKGKILVIDEMEARLHPMMTGAIINLFNSNTTNPKHAQLIFTTHDTNMLSKDFLRRDQIWFIEKDPRGCSHLYSLVELKVRNDASFENDYFEGRYGAIPFLGNYRQIIADRA